VHTAATKSVEMHGPEVADKGMERYLSIPLSDGPEAAAACSHIEHSRHRSTNTDKPTGALQAVRNAQADGTPDGRYTIAA
jgi:hypothetical protein